MKLLYEKCKFFDEGYEHRDKKTMHAQQKWQHKCKQMTQTSFSKSL